MEIRIYYQDTDCGGVVYYANYLTYFERARTEWLSELGFSVRDLMLQGVLFVVSHAELDYRSPSAYGDVLDVKVALKELSKASMTLGYDISCRGNGKTVVSGATKLVCVDDKLHIRPLPEKMKTVLSGFVCNNV